MQRAFVNAAVLVAAAVASFFVAGCDNPSCALSGDCSDVGGGGGLGGANAATTPLDHQWLSPSAPSIQEFYPAGTSIATTTPIALQFSESMAPTSLGQAFEIAQAGSSAPQGLPLIASLMGDGRLAVLLPSVELEPDTEYVVRYRDSAVVTDLQGTEIVQPDDREVGTFKTAASNPAAPRVVASFPDDGAANQSATGEYVVLFDRPLNPTSVNLLSWLVRVDGNVPAQNPAPTVLTVNLGQGSAPEARVWRWRSTDSLGLPVALAANAQVTLQLSPNAVPITAASGGAALATVNLDYRVAAFGAPSALDLVSQPSDAIGIDNLDGDLSNPLELAVDLVGASATDLVGIYLVGTSLDAQNARSIALYRELKLGDLASFDALAQTVTLGETEIDLASAASPVASRLKEGEISLGLVMRRGSVVSPVRMLDVDPQTLGTQRTVLDVTRPTFSGFGSSGVNTSSFSSDMLHLSVVGRASEEIVAAEVTFDGSAGVVTNGTQAPVVAASSNGLFVAAPVTLDVLDALDQGRTFDLVLYDRALNAALSTTVATFRQVGGIGPGVAVPGASTTIDVQVVDARTLAPISGARVFTHEDDGSTFDLIDVETTNVNGFAQIEAGATSTTLTIDASNYDLFSVTALSVSRVSVPLQRSSIAPTPLAGTVTNSTAFTGFDRFVSDSRRFEVAEPLLELTSCSTVGTTSVCQFGPLPVRPGPVGALSFFGLETPSSSFGFTAAGFLRSFALQIPLSGGSPGAPATANLSSSFVLSDATTAQEERALEGPSAILDISSLYGPAFTLLSGDPRVTLEALSPGLAGSLCVGPGIALDAAGIPLSTWAVRSALPGAVDPTDGKYQGDERGALVLDGTIEAGLYLRCEVRDALGARAGVRLPSGSVPATILPPEPSRVLAPSFGSATGALAYDVVFTDSLPDGSDPGIYRVTLTDTEARRWTLWLVDGDTPVPAADPTVKVPDLTPDGGSALAAGLIGVEVDLYSYPSFDPTRFVFSELERRSEVVSHSALSTFTQP